MLTNYKIKFNVKIVIIISYILSFSGFVILLIYKLFIGKKYSIDKELFMLKFGVLPDFIRTPDHFSVSGVLAFVDFAVRVFLAGAFSAAGAALARGLQARFLGAVFSAAAGAGSVLAASAGLTAFLREAGTLK